MEARPGSKSKFRCPPSNAKDNNDIGRGRGGGREKLYKY